MPPKLQILGKKKYNKVGILVSSNNVDAKCKKLNNTTDFCLAHDWIIGANIYLIY